jgi:hypothetical protein
MRFSYFIAIGMGAKHALLMSIGLVRHLVCGTMRGTITTAILLPEMRDKSANSVSLCQNTSSPDIFI